MLRRTAIVWALLMIFGVTSRRVVLAAGPTIVGGEPVVHIDAASNSGSVLIRLLNDTEEHMEFTLHVGDFVNPTTEYKVPADVTLELLGSDAPGPYLKHLLPEGSSAFVRLTISEFLEAGQADADLLIGETKLATVKAVKSNVPFNVSLQSTDPSHPELVLERGMPGRLKLRNDDPMTYRVSWSFWLPGLESVLGETVIAGRSTAPMAFKLPEGAIRFEFSELVKVREVEGELELRFAPMGDAVPSTLPTRIIPIKVKMLYLLGPLQTCVSWVITVLVLFLGGWCSVYLSLILPNKLRRIQLIRRLVKIAEKHRRMSSNIDSSLRVGAAVEERSLIEGIELVALFNANAQATLADYGAKIDLLERRVGLIQQLDRVTENLEERRAETDGAPTTILDDVKKRVEEATDILKLSTAEKDDFLRAQDEIQGAEKRLREIMNQDPLLAEQLAQSVRDLKPSFDPPPEGPDVFKDLRPKFGDLFDVFDAKYMDESAIQPHHYHWLSSAIERLYVLRHYVWSLENAEPDRKEGIRDHGKSLLEHLRIRSWNAVHHARRLRLQIEEDIFDETIQEALYLTKFSIQTLPLKPRPDSLVRLAVRFNEDKLNTCTARKEFTCVWDFVGTGEEEGWNVSRYFHKKSEARYTVSFRNPDGTMVVTKTGDTDELGEKIYRVDLKSADKDSPDRKQLRIEFTYLAAALLVAILGLIAGARAELMKLDVLSGLVAVFLLGFGADTVKNLISRRPQDGG